MGFKITTESLVFGVIELLLILLLAVALLLLKLVGNISHQALWYILLGIEIGIGTQFLVSLVLSLRKFQVIQIRLEGIVPEYLFTEK